MSEIFKDHSMELVGQIDPTPKQVEPHQSDYNAIVSHFRAHGKNMITIPLKYDTSNLNLAMDMPHHFKGDNIIREVPDGSFVGDFSTVVPDAIINNCNLGDGVELGDRVTLNNCIMGIAGTAGEDIRINNSEVGLLLNAKSVRIDNSLLMGMGKIDSLKIGDNNIIYPGYEVGDVKSMGVDNTILGNEDQTFPENPENTFLSKAQFNSEFVSESPELVQNRDQAPYYVSVRGESEEAIKKQKALMAPVPKLTNEERDDNSLGAYNDVAPSGPGAS